MKCKTLVTLALLPMLIGGCAGKSALECIGTGPFAALAEKLCPSIAEGKRVLLQDVMPVEERMAHAQVYERNGRVVGQEVGLRQTFWK